jgi:hypothetical protein
MHATRLQSLPLTVAQENSKAKVGSPDLSVLLGFLFRQIAHHGPSVLQERGLKNLVAWKMPLTGNRPQPDYSVGFKCEAFTTVGGPYGLLGA